MGGSGEVEGMGDGLGMPKAFQVQGAEMLSRYATNVTPVIPSNGIQNQS